jgi:hypothetical protein
MDQIIQQPAADPNAPMQMSAAEFAAKYRSKREIYLFLTLNCLAYLPRYENITIYFLKDLAWGTKK